MTVIPDDVVHAEDQAALATEPDPEKRIPPQIWDKTENEFEGGKSGNRNDSDPLKEKKVGAAAETLAAMKTKEVIKMDDDQAEAKVEMEVDCPAVAKEDEK
jgi:hypothetical protein